MDYTDKIIKLLIDLGFTTDNRHLLKTSGKINGKGFEVFYNAKINDKYYSALIGYEKSLSTEKYYIDSFNMGNGSLDDYNNYIDFSSPSFSKDIFNNIQEVLKYEIRKNKITKILS